jgi:hypothetical protein
VTSLPDAQIASGVECGCTSLIAAGKHGFREDEVQRSQRPVVYHQFLTIGGRLVAKFGQDRFDLLLLADLQLAQLII